jgi:3-isopropylmalate/(R)-2-methylmalate dehydratase small subunit
VLPQEAIDRLVEVAKTDTVTVDLETMTVTTAFQDRFVFEMDSFRRQCLMQGLDEIGLTLARDTAISKYEAGVSEHRPWMSGDRANAGTLVESTGRA